MADSTLLSQHGALQAFFRWQSEACVEVVADTVADGKVTFLPLEKVKSHFTVDNYKNMNSLLREVFESSHPPIDPELILVDHTAVFCILLGIGRGDLIEHFASYEELSDRRLPFDIGHAPTEFPETAEDVTFLQRFCDRQWMYCVPIFDNHMLNKRFGKQRLLPITSRESRRVEGLAEMSVIKVYGPYNQIAPPRSERTENANANTFVLKTYSKKGGENCYRKEVNGFRNVKSADSIIKFYGSYIHGNSFNILLEYADKGTLKDYFQSETPPSRGNDIVEFWEGLFQLIKGLRVIHSVREGHHDIRPSTVLVQSNGSETLSFQFKFASFGLDSGIRGSRSRESASNETDDTLAYEAPEIYKPYNIDEQEADNSKPTWEADVWSLGCIYSEAATWIADGYKGLLDYRKERKDEHDRVSFRGGDCFHDGERVLHSVLTSHREVKDRLRRSDHITKDVLETMVDEMLWEEDRPNAKALWRKAEMVLSRAKQSMSADLSDDIIKPGTRQGPFRLPPRLPIPTQPLPPTPHALPRKLSSIAEQNSLPNVERWRSQVGAPHNLPWRGSDASSVMSSPTSPSREQNLSSLTDTERDVSDYSVKGRQSGDNSYRTSISASASVRSVTSQPRSMKQDPQKQALQREWQKTGRKALSYRTENSASVLSDGSSYASNYDASDIASVSSLPSELTGTCIAEGIAILPQWNGESKQLGMPDGPATSRAGSRPGSRAGSRISSTPNYSIPVQNNIRHAPKASNVYELEHSSAPQQNNNTEYSPYPVQPETATTEGTDRFPVPLQISTIQDTSKPPFFPSSPLANSFALSNFDALPIENLSLSACLDWKKSHKKAKKHSQVPALPGAGMLTRLSDREHVFIVDDSTSMGPIWPDLKRVFEALSYVVKGMSPDGTELFFTCCYDAYRRKDTADLCKHLESKRTTGKTDIAHRLDLQMQEYRLRLEGRKTWAGPAANKRTKGIDTVRATSYYILTNGEWRVGADVKEKISEMADFLAACGKEDGQMTIQFVSFAENEEAEKRIQDIATAEYAMDIVDATSWKGNVLKMLLGPLNRPLRPIATDQRSESGRESRSSGKSNSIRTTSVKTMFKTKTASSSVS